jgi:hypothetical protein
MPSPISQLRSIECVIEYCIVAVSNYRHLAIAIIAIVVS